LLISFVCILEDFLVEGIVMINVLHRDNLADAHFDPYGEALMHSHENVDVISIMLEGSILHKGSLEDGLKFSKGDIQVQTTGLEDFSHNEINPNNTENRMLQL
jgi:redox-sensitive bicupin YhaK (pirin superfamily)